MCVDLILSLMTESVVGDSFGETVASGFNFPTVHRKKPCGFFCHWLDDTPTPEASQRQGTSKFSWDAIGGIRPAPQLQRLYRDRAPSKVVWVPIGRVRSAVGFCGGHRVKAVIFLG